MEKKQGFAGNGLEAPAGLQIGGIAGPLNMLTDALQDDGEKAKSRITEAVCKLREAGVLNLKKTSEKEGGKGEGAKAYNQAVRELQTASHMGNAEAEKLLGEMKS